MNAQSKTQILKIIYFLRTTNITHVGKLTLESEQLWSYSLVTLGNICVSMTHALQYKLVTSDLRRCIWHKKISPSQNRRHNKVEGLPTHQHNTYEQIDIRVSTDVEF